MRAGAATSMVSESRFPAPRSCDSRSVAPCGSGERGSLCSHLRLSDDCRGSAGMAEECLRCRLGMERDEGMGFGKRAAPRAAPGTYVCLSSGQELSGPRASPYGGMRAKARRYRGRFTNNEYMNSFARNTFFSSFFLRQYHCGDPSDLCLRPVGGRSHSSLLGDSVRPAAILH